MRNLIKDVSWEISALARLGGILEGEVVL